MDIYKRTGSRKHHNLADALGMMLMAVAGAKRRMSQDDLQAATGPHNGLANRLIAVKGEEVGKCDVEKLTTWSRGTLKKRINVR